ncbi:four helix bundle protein [Hymenobacter humi]|uniref:Four helix bundle protein n=1 Tax=Hymenobacter humi TaxID=1411620 RepID=A0ABW2U362_9BACT
MATIRRFEDLTCWQTARAVAQDVYRISKAGEMARDFGLVNQIRRAAGSVMDNIAEGFDRGSRGEFVQFLGFAKGSAGEVKSQLYRAFDQNYLDSATFEALCEKVDNNSRLIKGMLTYLSSSAIKGERYQSLQEPEPLYNTNA